MHRFFLENLSLGNGELLIEDKDLVFQIFKVLRFRVGEKFCLFNGSTKNYYYEVLELNKKFVRVGFIESVDNLIIPKRIVRLFFSMTKSASKMEFVLQKCTELGVSEFFPMITERSERKFLDKKERFLNILKEATEQSQGDKIPILHEAQTWKDCLRMDRKDYFPVFAHLEGDNFNFNLVSNIKKIDIFVGPEGGFSDEEYLEAKNHNFNCLKFSEKTLRAETASVAFSSLFLLG